jgi:hypothetical protein
VRAHRQKWPLSRTTALYIRLGPLYTHRVFGSKHL